MRITRWFAFPLVAFCGGCASSVATNVPIASAPASDAAHTLPATSSPGATASAPATPSPTPAGGLVDQLVSVVTDDLVVRSRPGTGSDSEIYPVRLDTPTLVYVIDGPAAVDGYAWYLVDPLTPPCYLGCDFEPQPGWVAAAGLDGERWLAEEPEDPDCPRPTLEELSAHSPSCDSTALDLRNSH